MKKSAHILRSLTAGCCALFIVVLMQVPAFAIESGGIGGKPANPDTGNPRSSSIFVYELNPGDVKTDAVQVINNTASEKTLFVYGVDSQIASGGAFTCAQKIDQPVSVGNWIKMEKIEVTVEPNSYQNVPFTIAVPQTASAGESNGCIVVQDAERKASSENGGIALSFRTAIRVAITVPGEITKDLRFTGVTAKHTDKNLLQLSTGLRNNGNVSLDVAMDVRLKTIFGGTVKKLGGTYPILARSEAAYNFEAEQPFWGGWYKVSAEAIYNSDPTKSIGEKGATRTISGQTLTVFVAPKPKALAIELTTAVVIVGGIAWLVWSRLQIKKLRAKSKVYIVKEGVTLHKIADTYGISWKKIAKINGLKPPYHLEPGSRIKIPKE